MNIYFNYLQEYYVYAYIRHKDSKIAIAGTPYYIGKGKKDRAWSKQHSVPVPKDSRYIVMIEHHLTEVGALALERRLIRWYGRLDNNTGILRNLTDGGEGCSNRIYSSKTREKIGNAHRGKKLTQQSIEKRTASRQGYTHSIATRQKISENQKGKIVSDETRRKISIKNKGKLRTECTDETRRKISNAGKGRPKTEEHKRKLSNSQKGRRRIYRDDGTYHY